MDTMISSAVSTRERGWTIYELVDPLGDRVIYRDYDLTTYVDMITAYPVFDEGTPGHREVDRVYRAGRVPYMRVLASGLTEAGARAKLLGIRALARPEDREAALVVGV